MNPLLPFVQVNMQHIGNCLKCARHFIQTRYILSQYFFYLSRFITWIFIRCIVPYLLERIKKLNLMNLFLKEFEKKKAKFVCKSLEKTLLFF